MTYQSAPPSQRSRLAVVIAAAGLLFVTTASAQTTLPPPAYGNADARQDRIEELEGQLTQSTAQNEDLQRQLNEANREIARLRGMVGELAGVNQSLSAPPPEGAPPAAAGPGAPQRPPTDQRSDAAPSTLNEAQRANTGTLGSISVDVAPATPVVDAGDAYSAARELLVAGKYADAELAFGDFLERYPTAPTAADARFWFAFTLLARNNYQDAATNFVNYLQHNPNAPRAPEARVRLGMALAGMGQTRQACAAFANLPASAARNVRDLAAREARAAQCGA